MKRKENKYHVQCLIFFYLFRQTHQINVNPAVSSTGTLAQITDEEHTLILMIRAMRLDEIIYVVNWNSYFPQEVPNKYYHIMNIVHLHFHKSDKMHTIRIRIEFISTQSAYDEMFQQHAITEIIETYRTDNIAESINVHEVYSQPFTTKCIQCERSLKSVYTHRSKTVMLLTRIYKLHK